VNFIDPQTLISEPDVNNPSIGIALFFLYIPFLDQFINGYGHRREGNVKALGKITNGSSIIFIFSHMLNQMHFIN
jgi:hypothetical protein